LNCLVAAVAAVGSALSGFGDMKGSAGQASGQTGAGRRFPRSPRRKASKPRFFKLAFLVIVLVATPVLAAEHYANNHPVLYNLISNLISNRAGSGYTTGNNIVDSGDDVALGVGTFSGAPYADSQSVYYTEEIYFSFMLGRPPQLRPRPRIKLSPANVHKWHRRRYNDTCRNSF
jgi:hypothetical protein